MILALTTTPVKWLEIVLPNGAIQFAGNFNGFCEAQANEGQGMYNPFGPNRYVHNFGTIDLPGQSGSERGGSAYYLLNKFTVYFQPSAYWQYRDLPARTKYPNNTEIHFGYNTDQYIRKLRLVAETYSNTVNPANAYEYYRIAKDSFFIIDQGLTMFARGNEVENEILQPKYPIYRPGEFRQYSREESTTNPSPEFPIYFETGLPKSSPGTRFIKNDLFTVNERVQTMWLLKDSDSKHYIPRGMRMYYNIIPPMVVQSGGQSPTNVPANFFIVSINICGVYSTDPENLIPYFSL